VREKGSVREVRERAAEAVVAEVEGHEQRERARGDVADPPDELVVGEVQPLERREAPEAVPGHRALQVVAPERERNHVVAGALDTVPLADIGR